MGASNIDKETGIYNEVCVQTAVRTSNPLGVVAGEGFLKAMTSEWDIIAKQELSNQRRKQFQEEEMELQTLSWNE